VTILLQMHVTILLQVPVLHCPPSRLYQTSLPL
jgi:hypothetical protein